MLGVSRLLVAGACLTFYYSYLFFISLTSTTYEYTRFMLQTMLYDYGNFISTPAIVVPRDTYADTIRSCSCFLMLPSPLFFCLLFVRKLSVCVYCLSLCVSLCFFLCGRHWCRSMTVWQCRKWQRKMWPSMLERQSNWCVWKRPATLHWWDGIYWMNTVYFFTYCCVHTSLWISRLVNVVLHHNCSCGKPLRETMQWETRKYCWYCV